MFAPPRCVERFANDAAAVYGYIVVGSMNWIELGVHVLLKIRAASAVCDCKSSQVKSPCQQQRNRQSYGSLSNVQKKREISTSDKTHARNKADTLTTATGTARRNRTQEGRKQAKGHDTPPTVGQGSRGAVSEAHEVLQAVLGPNDREAVLRSHQRTPPPSSSASNRMCSGSQQW